MKRFKIITCLLIVMFLFYWTGANFTNVNDAGSEIVAESKVEPKPKLTVKYVPLGVPNINSSFKAYMDFRCVTNKNSPQYKFIKQWGWLDYDGFMRCDAEKDLGITDNYYLVALGSYYGTSIGTKYRITLDTGRAFYVVLADCKSNIHTNSTNQFGSNNNIIEFLVDTKRLNSDVKYHGSANVYMPLNGSVSKIERIEFVKEGMN